MGHHRNRHKGSDRRGGGRIQVVGGMGELVSRDADEAILEKTFSKLTKSVGSEGMLSTWDVVIW